MKPRYVLEILLLSAVWGASFLMIRIAGNTFPPFWVALLRSALGAALLWLVLRIGNHKLPPRQLLPWLLLVAFFNNALPFTFFAWGERTVPSNIAAVLNATTPIWTLLLSMTLHRSRATLLTIIGVLVAFAGVVLVVVTRASAPAAEQIPGGILRGTIIIAIGALAYAIATVIAKAKLQGLDPIGLATTQLSLAALMILPVALIGPHPAATLQLSSIGAIVVLGFAGSGFAYLLYYRLLTHVSATHVTAVTYLLPLWGIFWGLFAHEIVGPLTFLGVAITIVGLILLNLRAKTPEPATTHPPALEQNHLSPCSAPEQRVRFRM
jgi:drug/metabolite transporter (DMT)-like permease